MHAELLILSPSARSRVQVVEVERDSALDALGKTEDLEAALAAERRNSREVKEEKKRLHSSVQHFKNRNTQLNATVKALQAKCSAAAGGDVGGDQHDALVALNLELRGKYADAIKQLNRCREARDAARKHAAEEKGQRQVASTVATMEQHKRQVLETKLQEAEATVAQQVLDIRALVERVDDADAALQELRSFADAEEGAVQAGIFVPTMQGNRFETGFRIAFQQWLSKHNLVGNKREAVYELQALLTGLDLEVRYLWPQSCT